MQRARASLLVCLLTGSAPALLPMPGLAADYRPVTGQMLEKPDPGDWLMLNRTFDEQRFSPLDQINKSNVANLQLAFSRGLPPGTNESTPIVHDGIMYLIAPGASIQAIDATNGDLVWEYFRDYPKDMTDAIGAPAFSRAKSLAIYEDMIYFTAPDGFVVAIDANTGKLRWETKVQDYKDRTQHTGGLIIADGKVISNRTCETRAGCFISALDAKTGQEAWKFYNTPAEGEPNGETWGKVPTEKRIASSWGLPGSYDPVRKALFWAISNPKPYTRLKRHGTSEGTGWTAPADLYSNSTVSLDIDTGKLRWYYQHLPADDWDTDHIHERTLVRTKVSPDPKFVKWINPDVKAGEERDVVVSVSEGGGIWALDQNNGQFLWATPWPADVPNFQVQDIELRTGRTTINIPAVFKKDGDKTLTCFFNTRSYWSTAYHPGKNALYIPYQDACMEGVALTPNAIGFGKRNGVIRPGVDPNEYTGISKVDLSTGEVKRIHSQPAPGNGSALVTGGDLLFWGDMNRRFHAFDADSGKILFETVLGGMIETSTITYAVKGRQFVAVMTGDGQSGSAGPLGMQKGTKTVRGHNAVYVFALPDRR
jgi:alcohol dehydrogenase (cytochrome c)